MQKYLISFFILFKFIVLQCAEPVIPATNNQVRAFRSAFATQITAQACQFEAIGIFVFINKLVSGEIANQYKDVFKKLEVNPLQIAEAVRLGYGFDRGVCSDLEVSPTEMAKYKAALTGIGQHVSNESKQAEVKHVFSESASQAAIASHLNLSNALMYNAERPSEAHHVKFMYAEAKYAGDKTLEASMYCDPQEINQKIQTGSLFFESLFHTPFPDDFPEWLLEKLGEFTEEEKIIFSNKCLIRQKQNIDERILGAFGVQIQLNRPLEAQIMQMVPARYQTFVDNIKRLGYQPVLCEFSFSLFLRFCACADIPDLFQKAEYFRRARMFRKMGSDIPLASLLLFSSEFFDPSSDLMERLRDVMSYLKILEALKERAAPVTDDQLTELFFIADGCSKTLSELISFSPEKVKIAKSLHEKNLLTWQERYALKKRTATLTNNQLDEFISIADGDSDLLSGLISLSPEKVEIAKSLKQRKLLTKATINGLEKRTAPLTDARLNYLISIASRNRDFRSIGYLGFIADSLNDLLPDLISLSPEKVKIARALKRKNLLTDAMLKGLEKRKAPLIKQQLYKLISIADGNWYLLSRLISLSPKKIKLAKLLKERSLLRWSSHDLLENSTDEQSQQMLRALKKRDDLLSENQLFSLLHLADSDSGLLPGLISLSPEKLENIKILRLGGSITEAMLNALEERAVPLTKDQLVEFIHISNRDSDLLAKLISLSPEKLAERLKSMKTLKEKFLPALKNHMFLKERAPALQGC